MAGEESDKINSPEEPSGQQQVDIGEVFATWDFPEHDQHQRSKRWYFISVILLVALLVYSYYSENPLLAVIILLGVLTFIITELRGPDYHSCAIAEDGLVIGQNFYAFDDIKNFYIIYQPPLVKMLYVEPKSILRPRIGIPLQDQDPVLIRDILLNFIPEDLDKEEEPISDFIGRLFKF